MIKSFEILAEEGKKIAKFFGIKSHQTYTLEDDKLVSENKVVTNDVPNNVVVARNFAIIIKQLMEE